MSTKNTNSKTTPKSETLATSTPNLLVQTTNEQTTPVLTETKKPSQKEKGGSKKNVKQTTPDLTVQTTPDLTVQTTTEQPTPVLTTTEQTTTEPKLNQKGGSKKNVKQTTPVVTETKTTLVVTETKSSQKGGSKKTKVVPQVEQTTTQTTNEASKFEVELDGVDEVDGVDGVDEQTSSGQRYFKLIYNNEIQGRYCGKKPKQAANKAFSSIIKDIKKTGEGEQKDGVNIDINFSIRECTRNSKHKEYKYVGIRESLDKPVKVTINNDDGSIKEITYNFHNKIQKAPKE